MVRRSSNRSETWDVKSNLVSNRSLAIKYIYIVFCNLLSVFFCCSIVSEIIIYRKRLLFISDRNSLKPFVCILLFTLVVSYTEKQKKQEKYCKACTFYVKISRTNMILMLQLIDFSKSNFLTFYL